MSDNKWTKEVVQQKLRQSLPTGKAFAPPRLSALDWSYREAAGVLTYFDPTTLRPADTNLDGDWTAIRRLLSDSNRVMGEGNRPGWMLRNSVRKKALARLGIRERMQKALQINRPESPDPLQQTLEQYIVGKTKRLGAQSLDELTSTLQVADWLGGILEGVPKVDEVKRRIAWERLLEPFRYLVGNHFRGRKDELSLLRDYVGVLPPDSAMEVMGRGLRSFFSLHEKPPMLIHGLGGIGKSTLLAKFILEHMQMHQKARFPFTYIDFDRPEILAEEPLTILNEALRQLGIEYSEISRQSRDLRDQWARHIAQEATPQSKGQYFSSALASDTGHVTDRTSFLEDFAKIMESIGEVDKPYLLVLDTFEEVQYRSRDLVAELWKFLNEMQHILPRLRTVLAGRAPIDEFTTKELVLTEFDMESGIGFLEAHGITDPQLARRLYKQIGGNPLSLQLAASVMSKEGAGDTGITDLETQRYYLFRVQESQIQGQLYRRILNHIHAPDVRKLAHPGLVLRRITPEIIEQVLAVPCGIDLKDRPHADRLFGELQREVTLVRVDKDGALVHRPDVRRVMLEPLLQDDPARVFQIHRRAVDYYHEQFAQKDDLRMRAEEVYHRLFMEADQEKVDTYWLPGIEPFLSTAMEEIPVPMRPYLASRLGIETGEVDWNEADLASWDRYAENRVRNLIQIEDYEQARRILEERAERRPGSHLYLLEAQVLVRLRQWDAARRVAKAGIFTTSQVQNTAYHARNVEQLMKLFMISAHIDEHLRYYSQAREMLDGARKMAEKLEQAQRLLEISVHLLRLNRLDPLIDAAVAAEDIQASVDLVAGYPDGELRHYPRLLHSLAGEVGDGHPDAVMRIVRLAGLGDPDEFQRNVLAEALTTWDIEFSGDQKPGELARRGGIHLAGDLAESWREFIRQAAPERLSKVLIELGLTTPPSQDVIRIVVDILKEPQGREP